MGSASSRKTERIEDAHVSFDDCDASELVRQSASEYVRQTKIPIETVKLCRIYNRHLSVLIANSLFFSRLHTMRRLQVANYVNLPLNPYAKEQSMRMAPDALEFHHRLLPLEICTPACPCFCITYSAYKRFAACSLITHLILLLCCAIGDFQRLRSPSICEHILNRVYTCRFVQVRPDFCHFARCFQTPFKFVEPCARKQLQQ